MAEEQRKLTYRKYDAISVEGPVEAKNGKQYYQALFEENASENGGYTSQSRGYTKNFFEDTHSLIFKRCEQHMTDEKVPVRMMAAKDSVEVNPYYMFDKNGKEMTDPSTGKQAIGRHLSIFLMPDENAETEIRRRSRTLHFVDFAEPTNETGENEKEAEILKPKQGK
jgi:hypothetical protein